MAITRQRLSICRYCPLFPTVFLFCVLFSVCSRLLCYLISVSSLTQSIRDFPENESIGMIHDTHTVTPPYVSPYDTYYENLTDYDRILFVQRNYRRFGGEIIESKRQAVIDSINKQENHLDRHVVFQDMKETGLGNSLLALASSYIVSRILGASYQGRLVVV